MLKLLIPGAAIAVVVVVYRAVAPLCRRVPGRRPWFIAGAIGGLGVAGSLVPWLLAKLNPPWSESPAGILIYLGKGAVVGGILLVALGALIGGIAPGRPRPPELPPR